MTGPEQDLDAFLAALAGVDLDDAARKRVVSATTDLVADLDPTFTIDLQESPPANGMVVASELADIDEPSPSSERPITLDPRNGSVTGAARALRANDVTSVELVERALARMDETEPLVHAWTHIDRDGALAAAALADKERADGLDRGPLHGIPVGIKDIVDVAALPITAGSRQLADRTSVRDATVVALLREAGAVVLGKTNTHEYALGGTTAPTRNPWALDRIPGGSSGGSAAAVAAGQCLVTIGTDTSGSIRIPASFCGVAGLKPTAGRVSRDGLLPMAWAVDAVGPIAREVGDLAIAMHAISGWDRRDPYSAQQKVPDFGAGFSRGGSLAGVRIGVPRRQFFEPAQPEILAAVEAALDEFRGLGATVHDIEIEGAELATAYGMVIFLAEAAEYHRTRLRLTPELFEQETSNFMEAALLVPATAYVRALRMQRRLGQVFDEVLRDVDVIAMPTMPCAPAHYGAGTFDELPVGDGTLTLAAAHIRNNLPSSLTGHPAGSQPCGFDRDGIPIGLEIAGGAWQEATVLRVMHAYESVTDWHQRRPALAPP